jgi:hypothetical protein
MIAFSKLELFLALLSNPEIDEVRTNIKNAVIPNIFNIFITAFL